MQNLLSPYSKVKVEWIDRPENYSKEAKNKIRNHFASKFGVNKNNITVIYKPVKLNKNGDLIEITGAGIDNIMDVSYQRSLMKELIDRDGKKVDFNRIIALDEKVNAELNIDISEKQHRTWSLKWLMINNFLSFGEENYLPFGNLKGLTVVNSMPSNTGGKTTLTIDTIKFLLHGSTTKTDKNEEIFNSFSEKNELIVRGMIDIEGDEFIIERKMRRTAKKGGGWTIINKLNFYKILPDGEEEELNEEDAKRTTIKLKEAVGTEKDFELLVLATEQNLDNLIGLTTTESGKILNRLIGLEVLELKETIVRGMYNDFNKKKKSNEYDVITLTHEIEEHNETIVLNDTTKVSLEKKLEDVKKNLEDKKIENDTLINSKEKIDVVISSLNPSALENEIEQLTIKGKALKDKIAEMQLKINELGNIVFDEDHHHALTKEFNALSTEKAIKDSEIKNLKIKIDNLIKSGVCQTCNRKLENVDNEEHIKTHNKEVVLLSKEVDIITKKITDIDYELTELNNIKVNIDVKNKLELDRDRLQVDVDSLRNQVGGKINDLKKYKLNLEAIEHNKRVEIQLSKIKTDITVLEYSKDEIITKLERLIVETDNLNNEIIKKTKLIEVINKESEVEKIFKIYIELVGKKGISKLVLRSVLPIINSEMHRLLDDVCDFNVEIFIDDKNDVQFLINKDDVIKSLKSGSGFEKTAASLVLRVVLGKISTLPMPNFITFDEVLGKVSAENLEKIRLLFDKIKTMYDIVFLITHNDIVKDWSDNVITVTKKDNISTIKVK